MYAEAQILPLTYTEHTQHVVYRFVWVNGTAYSGWKDSCNSQILSPAVSTFGTLGPYVSHFVFKEHNARNKFQLFGGFLKIHS